MKEMSVSRNGQLWLRHKTPSVEEVDVPATRLISFRITTTAHDETRMTLIAQSPVPWHTLQPTLLLSCQTTVVDAVWRIPSSYGVRRRTPVAVMTISVVDMTRRAGREDWSVDSRTTVRCTHILSRFQWNFESRWVDGILCFGDLSTHWRRRLSSSLGLFRFFFRVPWLLFSPLRLRRFLLLLTSE